MTLAQSVSICGSLSGDGSGNRPDSVAQAPRARVTLLVVALASGILTGCVAPAIAPEPVSAQPIVAPSFRTAATSVQDPPAVGFADAVSPDRVPGDPASAASPANFVPVSADQTAADIDWWSFFIDDRLRQTIELALANNRDLRIAAAQIEIARAEAGLQHAERLPTVEATAAGSRSRTSETIGSANAAGRTTNLLHTDVGFASYEIDLFGRLRNLDEAAQQRLLSVSENRRSVQISLVAEVARAWLTLAADLERKRVANDTLASRERTLALLRRAHELGGVSGLTIAQAQSAVEAARVSVAAIATDIDIDRNVLDLLAGVTVPEAALPPERATLIAAVVGAASADESAVDPADASVLIEIPDGLPSSVLLRRPDVRGAEFALAAARADIGAARAAYFPSISLTANAGFASSSLANLFQGASRVWTFAPRLSLPLFDGGARDADLLRAEAQRDSAIASYERSLQTAFREVSDAIAVRRNLVERQAAQKALVDSTGQVRRLAGLLFRGGASSYLEVLDAQRALYLARQDLIALRLAEQINRVTLYKVLGGG
jgi:multidrug efflux system outer membrane protein